MTRPDQDLDRATLRRGILAALAALLLAVGFAAAPAVAHDGANDTNDTNATNDTLGADTPAIEIIQPVENDTLLLDNGNATVEVETLATGFNLSDAFREGGAVENGTGHVHYWLQPQNATVDETCFSLAGGATSLQEALANNATAFIPDEDNASAPADVMLNGSGANATVAWVNWANETLNITDVPAGDYVLCVELVNNDHTALSPPSIDTVNFTVGEEAEAALNATNATDDGNATNLTNATNGDAEVDG